MSFDSVSVCPAQCHTVTQKNNIEAVSDHRTDKQVKASKHTRKETTKITKENSTGKTQMDTCRV
jgi:hypothetical protein